MQIVISQLPSHLLWAPFYMVKKIHPIYLTSNEIRGANSLFFALSGEAKHK